MTIVYLLNVIYNILSLFCKTNNEEFVIDELPFAIHRTTPRTHRTTPRAHMTTKFMTFFVDDISLPIRM